MRMNTDKAAGWIANAILKVQNKFATTAQRRSALWKTKQQWIFLSLVCLVFGGLSTLSVMKSFNKTTTQIIDRPAAIKSTGAIKGNYEVRITDDEIRKIEFFKKSLDSVTKTKLLRERPGLIDSIRRVEELYYSQKK